MQQKTVVCGYLFMLECANLKSMVVKEIYLVHTVEGCGYLRQGNFTASAIITILYNEFENYTF